ncbi:MAG: ester cyclase [Chloroflexota bacterium]|nr:ester cyclase [Chloroflexota bacterium]
MASASTSSWDCYQRQWARDTPTAPEASPANLIGECQNGTAEENIAVAEQYLDVWNSKDVSLFDQFADPDVVHHWGQGADTTGTAALKASTEASSRRSRTWS